MPERAFDTAGDEAREGPFPRQAGPVMDDRMAAVARHLSSGLASHQQGLFGAAEQAYRAILAIDPRHADALQLLGVLLAQTGRAQLGVEFLKTAVTIEPAVRLFQTNLAVALRRAGRYEEAAACYRAAITLDPGHASDHFDLAVTLEAMRAPKDAIASYQRGLALAPEQIDARHALGVLLRADAQFDAAADCFRAILDRDPHHAAASFNLAACLAASGKREAAAALYQQAIALAPDQPAIWNDFGNLRLAEDAVDEAIDCYQASLAIDPHYQSAAINLAVALNKKGEGEAALVHLQTIIAEDPTSVLALYTLGSVLGSLERTSEAIEAYRAALALDPTHWRSQNNLGNALLRLGQVKQAAAAFVRAIELSPQNPLLYSNLGAALFEIGGDRVDIEAAERCYREALALDPDFTEAAYNLAGLLNAKGAFEAAIPYYETALKRRPDAAFIHHDLGICLLRLGRLKPGWAQCEWRFLRPPGERPTVPPFSQPRWSGEPGDGGTILLWPEQGYGDAIQFIRYAPAVRARGFRLIIASFRPLKRLFHGFAGATILDERDPLPAFDVHCPLLSLPHLLDDETAGLPLASPYLAADPERVRVWAEHLGPRQGLRVGIAWRGNPDHSNDRYRSIDAALFGRLLGIAGVTFVILQKDVTEAEHAALARGLGPGALLINRSAELEDFAETAALMANLDLVISVDSAVCHLAGAIGRPVWTLLARAGDWRWFVGREDSPWYPSMRLFRQDRLGDWDPVGARVRDALVALSAGVGRGAEGDDAAR